MGNNISTTFTTNKNNYVFGTKTKNYFDEYNEKLEKEIAKAKAEEEAKKQRTQMEKRVNSITSIIEEDASTPQNVNSKELALTIMNTAQTTGVDPLLLACICKQETHFDQNKLGKNGKGMTQITSIVPKDMYARAEQYDNQMKKLIGEYKSLDKVFAAKDANPKLNLGDYGEMLYKYKTPEALFNGLKKDRDLNIKCGAYTIKFQLKKSDGDVRAALENYNGSSSKKSYATNVINYMNNAKSLVRLDAYC